MKRWGILLALLLLLLAGTAQADTTLMMYMCGTDLQSDCIADLKEMCSAQTGDHVNIVVLAGGASKWDDKQLKANRLNLFTIEKGRFSTVTDWGKASMGSADTLTRFVNYAWEQYHSDRNILVLWDHGGGTSQGVCFDEVFNDDGLTLTEINAALSSVSRNHRDFHLDIFGCDACLMAGYELAVLASDYADYFVASEELEPSLGWYYTDWLKELEGNPGCSTEALCRTIVDTYSAACQRRRAAEYTTLSVIDLHKLTLLRDDMESLSVYLQDALTHDQLATISRAVKRMYAFGSFESTDSSNDMYDLSDLLELSAQFAPDTTVSARQHLQEAVVYNYTSGDVPSACGLSVYIPQNSRKWYVTDTLPGYALNDIIPQYVGFVSSLVGAMNGSSYTFTVSAPSVQSASSIFDAISSYVSYIPCGTYNSETGTVPSFIAGTASQQSSGIVSGYVVGSVPDFVAGSANQTTQPASSSGIPSFIAGSAGSSASPAPQTISGSASEAVSINGIPSFIAGSANVVVQPVVAATDLAFSLQLNRDDMDHLSYAEGALFIDLSDDDGVLLLELGYLRNSWIDWAGASVYSAFDGTWPTLDDQLIVLYDRSVTEAARRSLIPVTVNGKETFLVVSFDAGSRTGRILGHNAGMDENGLLIRRVEPLVPGDVIVPQYTLYTCDWDELDDDNDMDETVVEGEPIIWRDDLRVTYQSLDDPDDPTDYQFAFYMNDIFGDYDMSDFFSFTM